MNVTSALFRLARFSADLRALSRAFSTGSPAPIVRRLANKAVGRQLHSRLWFK